MSEINRIQEEIAAMNRAAGKPAGTRIRRPRDEEGYEMSAEAPPNKDALPVERPQPQPPQQVPQIPTWTEPVQMIDLKERKIFGSIGTFPLMEEDLEELRRVAAGAMRRVIDSIGAGSRARKPASGESESSDPKPRTRPRANRKSRQATRRTKDSA